MTATERSDTMISKLDAEVAEALAALQKNPDDVILVANHKSAVSARWHTLFSVLRHRELFDGFNTRPVAHRLDEITAEMLAQ